MSIWQDTLEVTCTWDLGKRCNLDCSYCPPHRHDLISPFANKESLFKAAKLPLAYSATLKKSTQQNVSVNISFTGGEPTLNPNFKDLLDHIILNDSSIFLSVTTNGLFSSKTLDMLADRIGHLTLSYHCEANPAEKEVVKNNILSLNRLVKSNEKKLKSFNINLMVHAHNDYFEECGLLFKEWKKLGIKVVPRYIGEHPNDKGAHLYTKDQLDFIKFGWVEKENTLKTCEPKNKTSCPDHKKEKKAGTVIGRPCCGNRSFKVLEENLAINDILKEKSQSVVENRNFKGWGCLVNLFFIHIHQDENKIYYHQTCQANDTGERGPIGTLDDIDVIVDRFHSNMINKNIKPLICPNDICNCGLCITKSSDKDMLDKFLEHSFYSKL